MNRRHLPFLLRGGTDLTINRTTAELSPAPSLRREVVRKALHLLFVVIPLSLVAGVPRMVVVTALAVLLGVAVVIEVARARSARVAAVFGRTVGVLLRGHERGDHGMRMTGATALVAASLAAVWLLPVRDAIAVTWAVVVGDASAALVGMAIGGRLVPRYSSKSVEGGAACFLATFGGAYGLAGLSVTLALAVAAAATVAEWQRSRIDDNLRIAAATAAVLIVTSMGA
jgi:dolichol kinase